MITFAAKDAGFAISFRISQDQLFPLWSWNDWMFLNLLPGNTELLLVVSTEKRTQLSLLLLACQHISRQNKKYDIPRLVILLKSQVWVGAVF